MSNKNCSLKDQKCLACSADTPTLDKETIDIYKQQLKKEWLISENKKISHTFKFADFLAAIHFVNQVAEIAEKEGHHPNIEIDYNQVTITLWTHKINGLSENDFIVAAKIENIDSLK